jgi:flavin prenyltransferase
MPGQPPPGRRLVVGMTGSPGTAYGLRLLEALRDAAVESHLVACDCAKRRLEVETGRHDGFGDLADRVYGEHNQAARISSGSFLTDGMVIAPCSARAAAAIAHGIASSLIHRAADVTLKEGRRLVLLVGEAPLSPLDLEALHAVARGRGVVLPAVPAFAQRPGSTDNVVDETVGRILDLFAIPHDLRVSPQRLHTGNFRETPCLLHTS